jgi:hypothetical protein
LRLNPLAGIEQDGSGHTPEWLTPLVLVQGSQRFAAWIEFEYIAYRPIMTAEYQPRIMRDQVEFTLHLASAREACGPSQHGCVFVFDSLSERPIHE